MSVEGTTASSAGELVVSLEQANALIDLIGIREGYNALSSVIPVSGLIGAGLADSNGLTGDAEAILGPARTIDYRLAIRVVSPRPSIGVRNVRIWPSGPRSVVMRTEADGAHFTQVDDCDVPRILAEETLLEPGPTIHDGPPWISADFVQAVREVDLERAQSTLIDVAAQGPIDSHFSQDCWHKRWCRRAVRAGRTDSGPVEGDRARRMLRHRSHARANPRAPRSSRARPHARAERSHPGRPAAHGPVGVHDGAARQVVRLVGVAWTLGNEGAEPVGPAPPRHIRQDRPLDYALPLKSATASSRPARRIRTSARNTRPAARAMPKPRTSQDSSTKIIAMAARTGTSSVNA